LARFKAPRELVLVPSLPRTASGKIRRSALREEDSG
jgi:acyl-coenzyme A synthetase/AMP-(fatty) acid ligase